ncbi:MAG: hypothetical protein IPO67_17205 [Deltaproteobacteria bacterium]|nr:hypothetical protein [Deltaproteobacteria bacterium]
MIDDSSVFFLVKREALLREHGVERLLHLGQALGALARVEQDELAQTYGRHHLCAEQPLRVKEGDAGAVVFSVEPGVCPASGALGELCGERRRRRRALLGGGAGEQADEESGGEEGERHAPRVASAPPRV